MKELALYDPLTMDAVDAFRKDHGLVFEGNPRGLVDERLVEARRAAYHRARSQTLKFVCSAWESMATLLVESRLCTGARS